MPLQTAAHQPAEPSARAISSTVLNSSTRVPPKPPPASGTIIENRLDSSKAAETLSVNCPSRSDASASSLDQSADCFGAIERTHFVAKFSPRWFPLHNPS